MNASKALRWKTYFIYKVHSFLITYRQCCSSKVKTQRKMSVKIAVLS